MFALGQATLWGCRWHCLLHWVFVQEALGEHGTASKSQGLVESTEARCYPWRGQHCLRERLAASRHSPLLAVSPRGAVYTLDTTHQHPHLEALQHQAVDRTTLSNLSFFCNYIIQLQVVCSSNTKQTNAVYAWFFVLFHQDLLLPVSCGVDTCDFNALRVQNRTLDPWSWSDRQL